MNRPRPVARVYGRANQDERADELGAALREPERNLAPEGIRNDRRRLSSALREEFAEHVRRAADAERPRRSLASAPAGQMRDHHAPTRRENAGQRHEVPARHSEAVEEQHRLARTRLTNVHPKPTYLDESRSDHGPRSLRERIAGVDGQGDRPHAVER